MSYLDKIRACNAWDPGRFLPFVALGQRVGSLRLDFIPELRRWPDQFRIDRDRVDWIGAPDSFAARTYALAKMTQRLVDEGATLPHQGEQFPLTPGRRDQALCLIDRALVPYFGARAFGQHLNGLVRTESGIELWIGRRAADRRIAPLRLDNLVAGGLPHGIGLRDNLRKECQEEAGIAPELANLARPVSAVTYCRDSQHGLKPDVMYCYDLELPADFVPRCNDGEVAAFYRLPVAEVAALVRDTDEFKLNCNLVIIDFLLRHGEIPQEDPDYLPLLADLRSPLP